MRLKHLKTVVPQQDGSVKVTAMAWAPNNEKFAIVTLDRVIMLFDDSGEKRDKFSTKPGNASTGKRGYVVKGLAFSPDSTKLAVGQTDNILFVYKIGDDWGERKVICNKFAQTCSITCLVWPPESASLVFGLADGKVRQAAIQKNKSSTLYSGSSYCVSLCSNATSTGVLSGHADGTIMKFMLEGEAGRATPALVIAKHSCPPYALCWGSSVAAAGCDKRIVIYGNSGKQLQSFDYSKENDEKEFTVACTNPTGQSLVIGSYDRLRIFNWHPRRELWEELAPKEISNLYTITSLAWKREGSKLLAGTLCGGAELFDCCLRKTVFKNKFELTYVGLSQVIVKNLESASRVVVKSFFGYEIDDVKIKGVDDRYIVGHTPETLILADMQTNKLSEVPWKGDGSEKFYYENEKVCMVFSGGELSLIEYGEQDILASVRTEFVNPHLVSVRLNERQVSSSAAGGSAASTDNKKLAYLVDLKTICVMDLISGMSVAHITHEARVDWMEMNETGRKILFRDKKYALHLYDIETEVKVTILNYCEFVGWIEQSDVVVAQSRTDLCVWYNIDSPERMTTEPIKGDIIRTEKEDGKTVVVVLEGVQEINYTLDESLIEFGTAMDDGDYYRAVTYVESLGYTAETESMWRTLGKVALDNKELFIAERCFAAVGDVARARYLQEVNKLVDELAGTVADPLQSAPVRARMAVFDKQFKMAESYLLETGAVNEAIEMYQKLHKWDDAIAIAEAKRHPELENLRSSYMSHLSKSGQEEKAGEVKESNGDYMEAIDLYMKANLPVKAARLALRIDHLSTDRDLLERIASSLVKGGFHERAGDLFEKTGEVQRALEAYRAGHAYRRAVELARATFPNEVTRFEEEWGDHLVRQKQLDAAINHYIEAGVSVKAIEAAIQARQWNKAVQIVELQDDDVAEKYYKILAQHYASVQDYKMAEKFYVRANQQRAAVEMYTKANKFEQAYKLATHCMNPEEVSALYVSQAQELETQGRYKEAEKLYVTIDEADLAINMYKKLRMYEQMIKLVKEHHADLLVDTHLHLAKELEDEGSYSLAEQHYVEAGDWKASTNMYRSAELWEDAYRIAKQYGGSIPAKQISYMWAKTLGGDSAVKLLQKLNHLESAIEYACDNCNFEFAFELARAGRKDRIGDVHGKFAMFLEDEGKFKQAEENFVKAGKPKEAVLMYVHQADWASAQQVAEEHDSDSLVDVLVGQARSAFDAKDFQKCENFLLRAQRPELLIKFYKEARMWTEVLRIAQQYLPHKLAQYQDEYDQDTTANEGGGTGDAFLTQARDWESRAEYNRAIDLYMKVTPEVTSSKTTLEDACLKAVTLAVKFAKDRSVSVAKEAARRLLSIESFEKAAQVYQAVKQYKEAIDIYIQGDLWTEAKDVASEMAPEFEEYVEEKYVTFLKSKQMAEQLIGVDVIAALDMYAQRGEWVKCIQEAEQQSADVLNKYVAMYAATLIKSSDLLKALALFVEHGAPANPQNFNIYRKLVMDLFAMPNTSSGDSYKLWADARSMLFDLCEGLVRKPTNPAIMEIFEKMLMVSHYYAVRAAVKSQNSLEGIASKISVSLLRYSDLIPCDKAFFEAGVDCKAVGWDNMAFVFLNRYLDLSEGIEEQNLDDLDNSDFSETDIPLEVNVPASQFVPEAQREEIKEWVLAVSMDQQVEQTLPLDERDTFEGSLVATATDIRSLPCVITGYPVLRNKIEFKKPNKASNKDDWNKFAMATKVSHNAECQDVLRFLSTWCGTSPNSFSFM